MLNFNTIGSLESWLTGQRERGLTIGFVPTMGALHEGHLALVRRARSENDLTVVSIFVNPAQFNSAADLEKYPRMPEEDHRVLDTAGCDAVFSPSAEEMYPGGNPVLIDFHPGILGEVMEAKFRPGHFSGVATIVKKLFDIVRPHRAYFGKKDFQQLAVIRRLVSECSLPVEIVACETVREPDGLAMSSRNLRLTREQRAVAPVIHRILLWTRERSGQVPPRELESMAIEQFSRLSSFRVEYFEIVDPVSLLPLEAWNPMIHAVACTAVWLGEVRLIDNMELFS
jgi:pantoate--beta-alanine ligase